MNDIGVLHIGDSSDPDWVEARRLATNLISSRVGGADAMVLGLEQVTQWVNGQSPAVVTKRLFSLAEALLRFALAAVAVLTVQANDPGESFITAPAEPEEVFHLLAQFVEESRAVGGTFTITGLD